MSGGLHEIIFVKGPVPSVCKLSGGVGYDGDSGVSLPFIRGTGSDHFRTKGFCP